MLKKFNFLEFCWLATVVLLTSTVVMIFTSSDLTMQSSPVRTLFGIDLTYCIVVFYAFNTFLFFGIKEFFGRYERKFPNTVIMFVSGVILTISLLVLNII